MINYDALIYGSVGIIIGAWNIYLFNKIRKNADLVNDLIDNFPTPEQLAKEILKVKMPLSELPDDVKQRVKEMMGNLNNTDDLNIPSENLNKLRDKPSYMG